ncbi:hypothetical protein L1987_53927 [Smallanthus sonchifolius]|uniref:Uncharacterized protein n=1 Tax=Smallanthus sonchifolius TaxID=185202 RepID=A0ACB9E591_9ASTR|nr:hypothetical protein L1987_53927 [Smallanthus sonchifolius]
MKKRMPHHSLSPSKSIKLSTFHQSNSSFSPNNGRPFVPSSAMALVRIFLSLLIFSHTSLSQSQNPSSRALLKFKNSLSNSDSLTNWKDSSFPCDRNNIWVGIVCNTDGVSSINLAGMGLQGRPNVAAFAPLQQLESISLQNNSLLGPIPAFNALPTLKAIYASQNQFSGVIPPNYFQPLASLRRLWLSDNKFSGPIPMSLGDLMYLKELHLENNEFSGPIPGPINRFDKEAFENNPDLCGLKASKLCPLPDSQSVLAKKLVIAAVVVTLLLLIISMKDKRKEENMRIQCKGNINEAVVTIPNITRKSGSGRKGYAGLNKAKSKSRKSGSQPVGELVIVNEEKGVFGSQDLMEASAEVLGNGGLGSAYKATLGNGLSVVLKRMKEMNKMSKDVLDTEMRKLGGLKHQNILTPLAYHFRKEDKFLVSEYVPKGSLHNVLHGNRGLKHSELRWPNRLKMIKGVAQAMGYLHSELASYELPHGNLKSCNVLIGQDYEPLVSDYALHPLINSTSTAQSLFAYRSPEAIQVCHKSDVYCLGIVILEVVTGRYPSQYILNSQKGESGTDVVQWVRSALDENREGELMDPELPAKECVEEIEKLLRIGAACTESEVDRRIDMKEAIKRIEDV